MPIALKCPNCRLCIDECYCDTPVKVGLQETSEDKMREIIISTLWMARRYAHGRKTYAVSMCNDAIDLAISLGIDIKPDSTVGGMYAKDGMFDKEWFEDNKDKL